MISLHTTCAKLCENFRVDLVQNSVNFSSAYINMCKKIPFPQLFNHIFRPLLHKNPTPVSTQAFSHFHSPYYYYYDILNNINNRKVQNGN